MFDLSSHILIVDDMKTMRKLVLRACKEIGFTNFTEAADGAEAWTILNAAGSSINIVISDWNMPNCTGLDLLKRVRADSRTKALPFLLLTAESEAAQVQAALQAGVDNYVIKPFSKDVIETKLGQVYNKKKTSEAA
jgi:two-component system chemotaxis response regulator CheY